MIWSYLVNHMKIYHKVTINPRIFDLKIFILDKWIFTYDILISVKKKFHICPRITALHVEVHSFVLQVFESILNLWNIILFLLYNNGHTFIHCRAQEEEGRRERKKKNVLSLLLIFRLLFLFKVRCFVSQAVCMPRSMKCEVQLLP